MSLGLLVGRFGAFVRGNCAVPIDATPSRETSWPDSSEHLRALVGHHLIPLVLISRVDGNAADTEQQVIVDHCVALAKRHGVDVNEADRAALAKYVARFRPSLTQLDPALRRLERDSLDDLADLFASASAVICADGEVDPAELHLLDEIKDEAARLAA
jgi:tellurite resistance protein